MRRVDGRTVGQFFAEEFAGPLGLEVWIGLPAELRWRVATMVAPDGVLVEGPNPLWVPVAEKIWNSTEYRSAGLAAAGGGSRHGALPSRESAHRQVSLLRALSRGSRATGR
ncbi:hypothetical protein GCM10010530_29200 [Kribbella aluminosa]